MSKIIISASVTEKDNDFLNASYPKYKELYPTLTFEEFVGVVINQGIEAMEDESPANT
jgi:hypothetical protein